MKRTTPASLAIAALIGAGLGFLLDQVLTASGRATFSPSFTLPVVLVVMGVLVVGLAVPIRRATRGQVPTTPINPFRALRVAVLAKASSLVGAVTGGLGVGLLVFVLTRPVAPSLGSLGEIIATAVCGALLIAAGLVAEQLCTIRKDDDDEHPGSDDTGPGTRAH